MTTNSQSAIVRYLPVAARIILGLIFFGSGVFGLLMAFGVVPMPPQNPPLTGAAEAFMTGLFKSGYLFQLIKITEVVVGALLLFGRFVPLALVIIAPVVINIFAVHAFLMPKGLPMAIALVLLEAYLGWAYRASFRPLFEARARPN
jgi:uncharacterized membrane protein YphA (DoxX/SURF4 family)